MIVLHKATFSYGSNFTLSVPELVLQDFPVFLIGPNGSGKTTLLKIIGGFLKIKPSPKIEWRGKMEPVKPTYFAYLPARPMYDPNFTVEDYLLLAGDERQVRSIANELGLSPMLSHKMLTLSSGWLQRVFIARVLVQDTPYILMDEPTSFLDPEARKELIDTLSRFSQKKLIVSSHDLAFLSSLGKFTVGIRDGEVVFAGKPKDFFEQGIDDVFVKGYIM